MLEKLFEASLTGKGARQLTSGTVEQLFAYAADKPFRLQVTEAHMIEPQADRAMFGYSISGPLPRTGRGLEADKQEAIDLFRKLDKQAQGQERYAMRYDVWFSD